MSDQVADKATPPLRAACYPAAEADGVECPVYDVPETLAIAGHFPALPPTPPPLGYPVRIMRVDASGLRKIAPFPPTYEERMYLQRVRAEAGARRHLRLIT